MDVKDFANELERKSREVDNLMRRKLPVLVGRMAKDHYQDNFRKGGFLNDGLHPWPVTRRQSEGSLSAESQYGPLLSRRNHLFSSVKYTPGDYRVTVSNDLPYAAIHNLGGETHPTVTPRMRRFAWAMYYRAQGIKKSAAGGKKKPKNGKPMPAIETPSAQFWKGLALTKKTKLTIRIPQRQFIGESNDLDRRINERIANELNKIIDV